ncbi:MAG TPA: hypothetical protein VGP16_00265 [Asanoa sp.]|jgi:hypothetical protein|nr:hypothetical protein [Asanoa sp.]
MLHDGWPLPGDAAAPGAAFAHGVPVRTVALGPSGSDCVFSVRQVARTNATVGERFRCLVLGKFGLEQTAVMHPGMAAPERVASDARRITAPVCHLAVDG